MAESPPVESPDDLIYIKNFSLPDTAPARQTRAAFDAHFKAAGFQIVDADGRELATTKAKAGGVPA